MPIKTGYKEAELTALAQRIRAQSTALVAALPPAPLQTLSLVCGCDRCIDAPAYDQLIRVSPPAFTTDLIGQYFRRF